MRHRPAQLILPIALGLLAAPLAADAQQPAKAPRIGILNTSPSSAVSHLWEAFRQGLRELGYVEGQTIAIEFRSAEGKEERLPDLAAELVRLNMGVIVASTPPAVQAAMQATRTIPIVMTTIGDPVGHGYIASLARPGGNITGLTNIGTELSAKRLELLKEVVPRVARMAVLWYPANPATAPQVRETEGAARALGLQLQILEVRAPDDLESAFGAATRGRAGALITLNDFFTLRHRTRIADLAAKSRLPAISPFRDFAQAGGLMSYGPSILDSFRRAATYVDKILKGAKPADLPVEQPTRFELVINMKTAKALGLAFPPSILVRADQVIQ